ncbi:MAG: hypothetical protein LQ347_006476 [Umbilicaria vellea]|nr:MAG: hypothetical protein LQ347_006476 [Umbilicaria vellea]
MAAISLYLLDLSPLAAVDNHKALAQVVRAEKKAFPKSEVFDFDRELRKRNTELVCLLDSPNPNEAYTVAAYLVFVRIQRTTLLHKICVLEKYRRRGLARSLLQKLQEDLRAQGCEEIQLWVDEARRPARSLYADTGFEEVDCVENYYAPGRTGIKMALKLQLG